MQIASRQPLWNEGHRGTEVELLMTPATGLYMKFNAAWYKNQNIDIDWGDGTRQTVMAADVEGHVYPSHTYASYGKYIVRAENAKAFSFSEGDGWVQDEPFMNAAIAVVDYGGTLKTIQSGGWKGCANLERFIAPWSTWMGQRSFYNCRKLREVVLGKIGIHYDGSFENCSALEKYTTESTGQCWSYIFRGCTRICELRLGAVSQFATQDFQNTPNLMDIWIDNKTVEQIKQVATEGNIVAGYSARFPWDANAGCRFHGTNGIVLGNGTIIHG